MALTKCTFPSPLSALCVPGSLYVVSGHMATIWEGPGMSEHCGWVIFWGPAGHVNPLGGERGEERTDGWLLIGAHAGAVGLGMATWEEPPPGWHTETFLSLRHAHTSTNYYTFTSIQVSSERCQQLDIIEKIQVQGFDISMMRCPSLTWECLFRRAASPHRRGTSLSPAKPPICLLLTMRSFLHSLTSPVECFISNKLTTVGVLPLEICWKVLKLLVSHKTNVNFVG